MAFMDVRMPPGWDGVETAARIWEVDPRSRSSSAPRTRITLGSDGENSASPTNS